MAKGSAYSYAISYRGLQVTDGFASVKQVGEVTLEEGLSRGRSATPPPQGVGPSVPKFFMGPLLTPTWFDLGLDRRASF